jgi:hypothetical protein
MSDWTQAQEARIQDLMKAKGVTHAVAARLMVMEEKAKLASLVPAKAPKAKPAKKVKADKPTVSKGDKTHYNQARVIEMFLKQGKTIRECAEAQKPMSQVYAHRILTTKVPKEYAAEQAKRAAAAAKDAK